MDNLSNILADITEKEIDSFILGDLNLDVLKYNSNEFVSNYIDNIFSHGFLQLVTKPTHCTSNSATLIDHIITNKMLDCYETCILISRLSDHFPIVTFIPYDKIPHSPLYSITRDFSEHNITRFKNNLSNISWNETYASNETQESYDNFSKTFLDLYDIFFPATKKKFNRNMHKVEKWFTTGLLISRQRKNLLAKNAFKNPSTENCELYKKNLEICITLAFGLAKNFSLSKS